MNIKMPCLQRRLLLSDQNERMGVELCFQSQLVQFTQVSLSATQGVGMCFLFEVVLV